MPGCPLTLLGIPCSRVPALPATEVAGSTQLSWWSCALLTAGLPSAKLLSRPLHE